MSDIVQLRHGSKVLSLRTPGETEVEGFLSYIYDSDPKFLTGIGYRLEAFPGKEKHRETFLQGMREQLGKPSAFLAMTLDEKPLGHMVINRIVIGVGASLHIHIWKPELRHQGIAQVLGPHAARYFMEAFKLPILVAEPSAENVAVHKLVASFGLKPLKTYVTDPSPVAREMLVTRFEITKAAIDSALLRKPKVER